MAEGMGASMGQGLALGLVLGVDWIWARILVWVWVRSSNVYRCGKVSCES